MEGLAPLALLAASSGDGDFIMQMFQTAYSSGTDVPSAVLDKTAEALKVTAAQAREVFGAISLLIKTVLFESVASKEVLVSLLPSTLDAGLQKIIVTIIVRNLAAWRDARMNSQLSLPRLKTFDWRLDIKTASEDVSRMSVPCAIVQMKVENLAHSESDLAGLSDLCFEVNKDTLATMLDGLGKIREQLESLVQAQSS